MRKNLTLYIALILMITFLSSCIGQNAPENGLFEDTPCGPPCLFDVKPELSNNVDVKDALKKFGFLDRCEEKSNPELKEVVYIECQQPRMNFVINTSEDKVIGIAFWPNSTITLRTIIERYGNPDFVTCYSGETTPEHPRKEVNLYYVKYGMAVVLEDFESHTANVKPFTRIDSFVYSPWFVEEIGKGKYTQAWNGYGEYKPNP